MTIILHNDLASAAAMPSTSAWQAGVPRGQAALLDVCKGHLTDIGGPVPAYNPNATEIYAECLRIPPVKIWDRGKPRNDVLNLIFTNMRARRDQEGDFNALIGACQVGERRLLAMIANYGVDEVEAAIGELLDLADRHMRSLIKTVPDGSYEGTAIHEDAGHGFGDIPITATVTIKDDTCHIAIKSPPQIPYFINSYEGNSHSGVYLGLMMFAQLPPPYNEGLYRCVSLDFGPKGTLCNATEPAPHMNCTTTPMETLTDAVRLAFEKAMPSKVAASWGHSNGFNISGWDTRTNEEYVTMVLATIISGAGATPKQDGWHACGPECCFGALTSGDVELLEYSYPIIIHRYSLIEDSGGAGEFRGGSGTAWEVEPLDRDMTFITFGEGRRIPAMGAAGATSRLIDSKVGRIEMTRGGKVETIRKNVIETLKPGETATNLNPGGGGYGDPYARPIEKVLSDVRNGLVSVAGAREDYGVVITDAASPSVDMAATRRLREGDRVAAS